MDISGRNNLAQLNFEKADIFRIPMTIWASRGFNVMGNLAHHEYKLLMAVAKNMSALSRN